MPKIKLGDQEVDGLEIKFKPVREDWNEYDLDDGSTIRMKTVVAEVFRIEGHYDNDGNPAYYVKSANMIVTKSPDQLRKK